MSCSFSINVGGKTFTVLSDIPEGTIKDVLDLERLLKNQPVEVLKKLKKQLQSIDSVQEIDLEDINENSVGLYSPIDLINSVSKNTKETRIWNKLKLDNYKDKNIVIAGFGSEKTPTQFYKNHIFLNLNYISDKDNKIVALTELALYNYNPDEYSLNSEKLRTNHPDSDEIIKNLLKTSNKEEIEYLVDNIKASYFKTALKLVQDISETNISTIRESAIQTFKKFNGLKQNIEEHYTPKTKIRVDNLKQGDLVLIPVEPLDKTNIYKSGIYEIFFDSYVDIDGRTIMRTLIPTEKGFETRKRIAKSYLKNEDEVLIKESATVDARLHSPEVYSDYDYKSDTTYNEVDTKFFKGVLNNGYLYFDSLLEILKNPQTKVIVGKTAEKIKNIQGSTVTLEDDSKVIVSEITKIAVPITNVTLNSFKEEQLTSDKRWSNYKIPTVGDHIAYKKTLDSDTLHEGIVLGYGTRSKKPVLLVITKNQKDEVSISYMNEKSVKYISSPPNEYKVSLEEEFDVLKLYNSIYKEAGNIPKTVSMNKSGAFRNSSFSVQEINKYTPLTSKDILFDKISGKVLKVVASKDNFIKAAMAIDNDYTYINIDRNILGNYLLFSKAPINESLALSNIRKNRYNVYRTPSENSVEVEIWQNPNGFVFTLPKTMSQEDRDKHAIFEKGAKNITAKMKEELKERYKWDSIPESLYISKDSSNTNTLKDTENTVYVPFSNLNFQTIFENERNLQDYIVPGSFITFKGNAKSFIVEKSYKDSLLVGYYHYTTNANDKIKNPELTFVKSEKFLLNNETLKDLEVTGIHLPKWATEAKKVLNSLNDINYNKQSKLNMVTNSDSPEIVMNMVNLIKDKFGVEIEVIHNNELSQFNNPEVYQAAAFVTNNKIYVNIDVASVEEPLHELLHLVLATMKGTNKENYYKLISSVQYHPLFRTVVKNYNDVNAELLEETFVKLLSKTFRNNILREGVFNEVSFNKAIKDSIAILIDTKADFMWEDSFDLLGKNLNELLYEFGSNLIDNEENLINQESIDTMFSVSSQINALLNSGVLTEKCNY